MSAVIHTFPATRPESTQPGTDELVDELARAVGREVAAPGDEAMVTVDGPRPPVSLHADRRGGSNDLVVVGVVSDEVRRRRLVVACVTVVLALVFALFAALGGATADGGVEGAQVATLQAGETLWHLADEITPPGQDVRPAVRAIMELNGFESATLPVGTAVRLPAVQD